LSLALRKAEIVEECITSQGVRIIVRAVAVFKVGDDHASIARAACRFLSGQDRMEETAARMLAGYLRPAVSRLTGEQVITERDLLTEEFRERSIAEMRNLGIVVDALEIQQIEDTSGYIRDLAAPHAAAMASQARIAKANADLEAAEREREVAELKVTYERDLEFKRAAYLAEADRDQAKLAADAEAYRMITMAQAQTQVAKAS
jgi:flotillin